MVKTSEGAFLEHGNTCGYSVSSKLLLFGPCFSPVCEAKLDGLTLQIFGLLMQGRRTEGSFVPVTDFHMPLSCGDHGESDCCTS